MKIALVFVVGCLAVVSVLGIPREYTTKYDNINLADILHNKRLLNSYYMCLIGTGKCTTDGKELRDILPDALANECKSCNERQKAGTKEVVQYLIENEPGMWSELKKKYDPEGKYDDRFPIESKNDKEGESGDAEKSA